VIVTITTSDRRTSTTRAMPARPVAAAGHGMVLSARAQSAIAYAAQAVSSDPSNSAVVGR
jgi:hypothetical protein